MAKIELEVRAAAGGWRVRAYGDSLGARSGRTVARYADLDSAIRETMREAQAIEARGFEVHIDIGDAPEEAPATR